MENKEKSHAMIEGGKRLGSILSTLLTHSVPGVDIASIEKDACRLIEHAGGAPSFAMVPGYKWATCLCVNDEVVHGVPKQKILNEGDIFTIDIGMFYRSFHTDTATTISIGTSSDASVDAFLTTGQRTLDAAIACALPGNHIGHISQAIQSGIEEQGYSIIKSLVGHGIGSQLHMEPQIPGFLKGSINKTPLLTTGMTIAIEVIYAKGKGHVACDQDDGWTMYTKDGSVSAVFEHTVLITTSDPLVLTARHI